MSYFSRVCFALTAVAFMLSACTPEPKAVNQFIDKELIQLHEAAHRREAASLMPYLKHANAPYRREAALLLGAVQDTAAWTPLLELLVTDSNATVRAAAAYAVGQLPVTIDTGKLLASIMEETDDEALIAKMEAIGKLTRPSNSAITSQLILGAPLRSEAWRLGCAKALFWMHMQGIYDDKVMERMPYMLQYTQGPSKMALALAMARYKGAWFEKNSDYLLSWLHMERSPEIRIHLLTMMGKSGSEEFLKNLTDYAVAEGLPINLRIAAIRSLQRSGRLRCPMLIPALSDKKPLVVLACLEALAEAGDLGDHYTDILRIVDSTHQEFAAPLTRLRWAAKPQLTVVELPRKMASARGEYDKAELLNSAIRQAEASELIMGYALDKNSPVVRTAAATALNTMMQRGIWKPRPEHLLSLIQTHDVGVISAVLPSVRPLLSDNIYAAPILPALETAAEALTLPRDMETYNELADALNAAGITSIERASNTTPIPMDWETIVKIPENRVMRIRTEKGDIEIKLDVNRSPASVAYISKLAAEGFYTGKFFHRIVPGFVAQGGCPRGDGMGSTDALLRSEWIAHQYEAGTVGLASSGKDTESCQWFITLDQTPHLEGRYTIIGQVTSGLEVAQKLIVGDVILEVTIEDPS
jgi:cyclophilin family peptidyl-prolyl cis-trans isomerase/HEAT repeat protein